MDDVNSTYNNVSTTAITNTNGTIGQKQWKNKYAQKYYEKNKQQIIDRAKERYKTKKDSILPQAKLYSKRRYHETKRLLSVVETLQKQVDSLQQIAKSERRMDW